MYGPIGTIRMNTYPCFSPLLLYIWIIASKLALGQVTKTFNSPIARTWALWSSFGAAHFYIAGCDAVELHGFGVGSVRVLSMYGNKITWRGFADRVVPGAEESLKLQLDALYNDSIEKARKALEK
ncbi:hypothetical protein V2G26_000053 [Clonostachys chloroleuca]